MIFRFHYPNGDHITVPDIIEVEDKTDGSKCLIDVTGARHAIPEGFFSEERRPDAFPLFTPGNRHDNVEVPAPAEPVVEPEVAGEVVDAVVPESTPVIAPVAEVGVSPAPLAVPNPTWSNKEVPLEGNKSILHEEQAAEALPEVVAEASPA